MSRGNIIKFLFDDGVYFVAVTDRGCVRIGIVELTCYDIPRGHAWYDRVADADTREAVEDLHDQLFCAYGEESA